MPVQKAAFKVEAVFEKLIDDLKDPIQQRLEHLVDTETSKLYREIGGLKSELKHANRQIDYWKAAREEVFQRVMETSKENERLAVSVDSLTRQIDELKKKQPT